MSRAAPRTFEVPLRFLRVEIGTRMTVLDVGDGLLVHSPIPMEDAAVKALGPVRWLLAPNLFHHLHVGPWIERGLQSFAPAGLEEKRKDLSFTRLVDAPMEPLGPDLGFFPMKSFPPTKEVVLHHRPSRTLVTSDLVFNFTQEATWGTRLAMRMAGAYPGCRASLLERLAIKRSLAREEIGTLLALDFDRLVLAHGAVIETGGKDALRAAYRWLGL
ncbi:MAG: hypothetical protein AAF447_25145 [Myxococcota bacterium]